MALSNTQVVALQLEKVRRKLPLLYERADSFFSMIQKRGDVEKVSTRTARIPLQVNPGGAFGYASFDGDDLGLGSGTANKSLTVIKQGCIGEGLFEITPRRLARSQPTVETKNPAPGVWDEDIVRPVWRHAEVSGDAWPYVANVAA